MNIDELQPGDCIRITYSAGPSVCRGCVLRVVGHFEDNPLTNHRIELAAVIPKCHDIDLIADRRCSIVNGQDKWEVLSPEEVMEAELSK